MKNNSIIISAFTLFLIISSPISTFGNSDGNNKKIHFGIKAGPINSSFRFNKPNDLDALIKDSFHFPKNYGLNAGIYSDIKLFKFIYYSPELRYLHIKLEVKHINNYTDHYLFTQNIVELAPVALKLISQRNSPLNFYLYGGAGLTWSSNYEGIITYYDQAFKSNFNDSKMRRSSSFIEGESGIFYSISQTFQVTSGLKFNYAYSSTSIPIEDRRYGGYFGGWLDYYYTALNFGLRF